MIYISAEDKCLNDGSSPWAHSGYELRIPHAAPWADVAISIGIDGRKIYLVD